MTKYNVDMDDYDETKATGGYTGPQPTRGVYQGKLISVEDHTSGDGNEGLHWVFEISKGEFKGWRGHTYSNMDSTKWKTQQTLHAITGSAKGGTIDTAEVDGVAGGKMAKKAKEVNLRVNSEMYEGEKRAKLQAVLLLPEEGEDDGDDESDPFADE